MLWRVEKLEDMISALKNHILFLEAKVYSIVGHQKMRSKDDFRAFMFPQKLCAKLLCMCIFSEEAVKDFKSDIQRDSSPKKCLTTGDLLIIYL